MCECYSSEGVYFDGIYIKCLRRMRQRVP